MLKAIKTLNVKQQDASNAQITDAVCNLINLFMGAYVDAKCAVDADVDKLDNEMVSMYSLSNDTVAYVAVELLKLAVMAEGEI